MKININIKGVGCDIVDVSRFEKLIKTKKFLDKVYTSNEQNYIKNIQTIAGLWAAKEAVSKALGTGFTGFVMKDIEILHTANGQPFVVLYNGAKLIAQKLKISKIHISISHEKQQALAFVIAI